MGKLFTEQLCKYYLHDFGMETRIVRFHNVYGPLGTYEGNKEKAPAAISRKVALASDGDTIEIWGDGLQTRSFMFIEDCVEGLLRLMASRHREPLNLGTEEMVSVDQLVDMVCEIAGKKLVKAHDRSKPQGVRGRNSDNSRLRTVLGWEPTTQLRDGLEVTYSWIEGELRKAGRVEEACLDSASTSGTRRARANVLGVGISAINMEDALRLSEDCFAGIAKDTCA